MKPGITRLFSIMALCAWCGVTTAQPKKTQLGLEDATGTKSLRDTLRKSSQDGKLDRLVDSLNQHMIVSFKGTRKFDVIARGDLAPILKEQQLPGFIVDPADHKSLPGKVKGLDYLLVAAITDFADVKEGTVIEGEGLQVSRRTVQATMVLKLYNTTTGALLEAVDVPVLRESKGVQRIGDGATATGTSGDALIEEVSVELAKEASSHVTEIIFPAKVMAVTDGVVTINRGEGTNIAPTQPWEVFALGKELKDPETGEVLGQEEIKLGEIVITDVLPKFSKGRIIGENRGIDEGCLVRRKVNLRPLESDRRPPRDR